MPRVEPEVGPPVPLGESSRDLQRRAAIPGVARLVRFHGEVRRRLRVACELEALAPERFGFRLETAAWLFVMTGLLYRRYFRVECHGLESLPPGPFMLVANHGSRVLSWDGAMIMTACLLDGRPPRLLHAMAEHRLMELPVLGRAARRIGAVDGRRPACEGLLRGGAAVLTFPEGTKALAKPRRDRYRLAPFGQGFMHVAQKTGVPIVPVAVIGSEEEMPAVVNARWLARILRTPVAPLSPTVVVPLPVKHRVYFGAPMHVGAGPVPDQVEQIRTMLQSILRHQTE